MHAGWCWGCCRSQKQHIENVAPKTTLVCMDGLAGTGLEGWCWPEGQWESKLKVGCCERTDVAVRTQCLQARGVHLHSWQNVKEPGADGFKTCCSLKLTILLPIAWLSCFHFTAGFGDIWARCCAQRACQWWLLPPFFFSKSTTLWFVLYLAA